jgi:hypothetical protein
MISLYHGLPVNSRATCGLLQAAHLRGGIGVTAIHGSAQRVLSHLPRQ